MPLIETRDFNNKSPFEQLDFVLEQFVKNKAFRGNVSDGEIIKELFGELKVGDNSGSIIIEILGQLHDDKYLHREVSGGSYRYMPTFKGRLFFDSGKGGYCQMQEDINLERAHLEIANSVAKRDSKITAWGSVIAAIGAIILIFGEILKVIHHNWIKIQSFFSCS